MQLAYHVRDHAQNSGVPWFSAKRRAPMGWLRAARRPRAQGGFKIILDCLASHSRPGAARSRTGNVLTGGCLATKQHTLAVLAASGRQVGDQAIAHTVTVYDPLEVFGEGGALADSGAEVKKPTFFYGKEPALPAGAAQMRDTIKDADCLLVVTPEYNHAAPPALLGMLDNFGGSNFGYKPLGIVTYSAGPWGGMRAAMALRPIIAELGAMSASRIAGFPNAGEMFHEDGTPKDPEHRMLKQVRLPCLQLTAGLTCRQATLSPR